MKKTVFLWALLIAGLGLSQMGCMPKPKVLPQESAISAGEFPEVKPRFGRFNLQKRHGLGAWEGGAPASSERDLLKHLSQSSQPLALPHHKL